MTNPSLEAVHLFKRYDSFPALTDLSLKLEGAKCVGFLGPNGAGKSTTLKIFTNLIFPTKGEAFINGIDVKRNKKGALARCSALIETPEIYPSLTPREALSLLAETRGVPREAIKERLEECIAEVKMQEWIDRRVGKFSKGMKQRVNIAAALLADPEVIILDEPSMGLDPRGMSEVRDIVKALKNKKRLIFMSSHILSEVWEVCDEVAIIDHGKLLVYDTIQNVVSKFSGEDNPIELGFVKPVEDSMIRKLSTVAGIASVEKLDEKNLRIRCTGGLEEQARIFTDIALLRIGTVSFKSSVSALEDAYLSMIQKTV